MPELATRPVEASPLRAVRHVMRVLPWISLAVGIVGAVLMDRKPERAPWIAGAAVLSWVTLLLRLRLTRGAMRDSAPGPGAGSVWQRIASFSSLMATQSLIHLLMFFALPFYFAATTLDPGHLVFAVVLVATAAVSLWDPWSAYLLGRPVLVMLFPAWTSFAALNAVLPGLGLSNVQALWVAASLGSVAAVLIGLGAEARVSVRTRVLRVLGAAIVLPTFLALGGARLIPAAPMRLMRIELGTQIVDRQVVDPTQRMEHRPDTLVCATAVFAPLGVREQLLHVWRVDGEPAQRIKLTIRGGRGAGFRTFSRIRRPRDHSRWQCRVETASGQLLGSAAVVID